MSIQRHTVTRLEYLFGHNRPPSAVTMRPYVSKLAERNLYGLAIAADSEVRGVRVRVPGERDVPLVEGAPLLWPEGIVMAELILSRHDYHDGRLVLEYATTPADMPQLARHVATESVLRLYNETMPVNGQVHMQRPRAGRGFYLLHGATVYHAEAGPVTRDRRWLVDGELVTSNPADIIGTALEFGDATIAATRVTVDPINVTHDVVVTKFEADAGLLSAGFRWAEGVEPS